MSLTPGSRRVVTADGELTLHVRLEGAGPPVLLIHGLPGNAELWRGVIPRLAERARVVGPDLLGYGRSDPPGGEPLSLAAHAGRLVRLLDALEIPRATVVGHDIGGGIAQILAVRHPERVERLGLIDAVCYDNWPVWETRALRMAAPVVERLPDALVARAIRLGLRRGFTDQRAASEILDAYLAPFSRPGGMRVLMKHLRALDSRETEEIAPALPRLRIPVAVAWGHRDPFLEPRWAERLAADIPTAQLTWLEGGHYSPADDPDGAATVVEGLLVRE